MILKKIKQEIEENKLCNLDVIKIILSYRFFNLVKSDPHVQIDYRDPSILYSDGLRIEWKSGMKNDCKFIYKEFDI